jgi:TP901 family phage tail tape measure protein
MANVFDISFVLNSALAHSFTGTFSTANKTMGDLQKRMSSLSQNQSQIAAFGQLQSASQRTGAQFYAAQQKAEELAKQMRNAGTPSEALTKQFTEAQTKAGKLHEKLKGQRDELSRLRTSLSEAGINTRGFSNEQARLAENTRLAAEAAKLQAAQTRVMETQGALNEGRQGLSNMRGQILASAGIVMAMKAPLQQAAAFEQAMARVQAVTMNNTGTKAGAENMRLLSEQARQLGRDTQFTAAQAANSQEMLARAGFNTTEIIGAMPGLLNMAAAEGMDLANAADISASVLRGFGLEASQSMRVADVLAKASSTTNTSIATLGESMKVVAPVAAGLGISLEQTAAMIGVMGNAGIKGSLAGNALKAALLRLAKEPAQAAKALGEMGIALKDDAGRLRTMPSLMQALHEKMKNMGEGDQMNILTRVFGAEAASGMLAVMNAATGNKDLLKELEIAYANAAGTSSEMAGIMNDTAQGAMARFGSAAESLSTDIGNVLLPPFTWLTDTLAALIGQISGLAQNYPRVTKVVVGGAAAFGAATVAITSMRLAVLAVKMPFLLLQAAQAKAAAAALAAGKASMWAAVKTKAHTLALQAQALAAKACALAQRAWNAVMSANPIGLIVIGIAGLVAAGYYLYKNWDTVCAAVSAAWDWVWGKIKAFWEWLTGFFNWDGITAGFDTACKLVSAGWTALKGLFSIGLDFAVGIWDGLKSGWESAKNLISSGWDSLKNSFAGEAVSGAWSWLKDLVGMGEADAASVDQAALAAQLNDITMLNKMSEGFAARAAEMTAAWQPFKDSLGQGFETVFDTMARIGGIIRTVVIPAVKELNTVLAAATLGAAALAAAGGAQVGAPNPAVQSAAAAAYDAIPYAGPQAAGGFFDAPHFALLAEAGAEAVIPLENRSRGIPLWAAAGEAMGMSFGGNTTANNVSSSAPTINITVNGGDPGIARSVAEEVRRALREIQEYEDRVSFA